MIYPPRKMAPGERLTAADYNALLDYVRRTTPLAGANVTVDYRLGGAVISGAPGGEAYGTPAVKPFTVRHHEDQWEIYLPYGCVNAGGTCAALNPPASNSRGSGGAGFDHVGDDEGWRILYLNEQRGTSETDSADHDYREWTVTVHVKPAKVYGADSLNAPARRLVWASATDRLKADSSLTDAERYADTPGDIFSFAVARIRVTTIPTENQYHYEYARVVTQLRDTLLDIADVPAPTGFDLVWYLSVADANSASDGSLRVNNVYCLRQLMSVAGIGVTGAEMTDVTDAEDVYARVNTSDMSSGAGRISVVADPGGDVHASDTLITWLALYTMKGNTVTGDHRENSLKNVQLYRA